MFYQLLEDQSAASMAEYAMLLALLTLACIGVLTLLKGEIIEVFGQVGGAMQQG